ncbi:DUF4906 domain-containing protein [Parabacteroides distasonis]|uniref:DUF4906 domain-containing protein n=1 Tax=Parabacteroides distasonis TaxID=823 RepID=UPI00216442E5|nr:DUF4906 domain-containing protein [Parabacteroides distasonis]UVR25566.1 DUF4906 domain-containing protein [Parabacteroides distasonis]
MTRTTGILRNMLAAVLLTAAAACTEEMDVPGSTATEGREATVLLSVSAAPVGAGMPGTRALPEGMDEGTDPNYEVKDIWLMEYNDAGEIVGSPQYYTKEELKDGINVPIILPVGDAVFKCVVVANTHIPDRINEAIGDVSTLAKLRALCRKVETPDDMHNKDTKDLLMNCVMDITSTTKELDCKLYRNIAKFTLKLKNLETSGVNVNTVQLCNVPDRMFYADRLYGSEQGAKYPSPTSGEAGFRTWEAEYVKDVTLDADGGWIFDYYLPRNCRGTNTNTNGPASEKNRNAPEFATYVEIMAEDTKHHTPVRYRFYLGENMTDNFNVVPNRHYILPVTIEGKGASTDSRVEDLGTLTLPESNCYIVNPLNGGVQQIHSVPITRINKFWDSVDGKIATDDQGNKEDNHVYPTTRWVAEVIWQDAPTRLFDFCDKDGKILSRDDYIGTGESDFHFKPREGARGNVLIGVRKETQNKNNYLWSWHLWITDYNPTPNRTATSDDTQYAYSVQGGGIHRYNSPGYTNQFVMDRNLGAMGASADSYTASRGLYYQFGRKDPFPYPNKSTLYDINGKPQTTFEASPNDCIRRIESNVYFYQAVKQPYNYYISVNWVKDNNYPRSAWYNPDWYADASGSSKTIFDPSPPGWKIPDKNLWSIFSIAIDRQNYANAKGNVNEHGELIDGGASAYNNGWYFYMGGIGVGETAWYPSGGYRNYANGDIIAENNGYYWATEPNAIRAYCLKFSSTKNYVPNTEINANGQFVRCIQDPDYRPN